MTNCPANGSGRDTGQPAKQIVKWLWLLYPTRMPLSEIGNLALHHKVLARSMRRARCSCAETDRRCLNIRPKGSALICTWTGRFAEADVATMFSCIYSMARRSLKLGNPPPRAEGSVT